ncbi:hypothetical protein [Natronococcus jeotgali]|uniref:Uncharacterized protein n=1 Tax=Natronococcus jeotgali DSM 18795 TaxID=1227498 RepID=L9WMW4_9EURY|nr:hypothetical protein [Natronococcus jeotgali]ELY50536.1 hypothetical protein C492_22212 [Natronococcus jeotgali DSM 18795]
MSSRENRAILAAFGLFVLALAGLSVLEERWGHAATESPVVELLVLVGIPIVLPQLYLARTDGEIPTRSRLWLVAGVSGLYALQAEGAAGRSRDLLVLGVAGAALALAFWYEARGAYRRSVGDEDATDASRVESP